MFQDSEERDKGISSSQRMWEKREKRGKEKWEQEEKIQTKLELQSSGAGSPERCHWDVSQLCTVT